MKVKIGNYPSRWISNVYSDYMVKKYGYDYDDSVATPYECFLEYVEDALQWVYNHTINLYIDRQTQKVSVKIDRWDTWGMDHTLAYIVVPMLKQLKETKHGAPNVDPEDVPEELRPTEEWKKAYEGDGTVDPDFFKRWDWVMDEMIWAFEQKTIDWEEQYYGEWVDDETKPLGGYSINADDEGRKAHQERMTNGFRLFGKYYEALWD